MEFLSENYIWLIVVGVFIIMVIIGYLADKKQNGGKKTKLKDHVEELNDQDMQEPNEVQIDEWEDKPIPKEEDEIIEVKGMDNSFDSWDTSLDNLDENTPEENSESNSEEVVDNQKSTDDVEPVPVEESDTLKSEEPFSEPEVSNVESVQEETTVPEETNNSDLEEESTEDETNPIEDLEITLPNIDTLNDEIKDVVNAEDVWKF